MRSNRVLDVAVFATVALLAHAVLPNAASAQFTSGGKKVLPIESNFAGVRQVSPRYGVVVQINHDARTPGDFELSLLDETYAILLRHHRREPVVPASLLPVVFVSEAKMARFGEGGRRRMFRWLESDLRKHPELYLSPAAIFVSDTTLSDREKLRSVLARALGFLFDERVRLALDSLEPPQPDR